MAQKTLVDKKYEALTTNDGYIVDPHFGNALKVKSEVNKLERP